MQFSFKKYLCAFLITIVLTIVCIPLLSTNEKVEGQVNNTPDIIVTPPEETDIDTTISVPIFRNVYDAYSFAYQFLEEDKDGFKGFEITNNTRLDALTKVLGIEVVSTQNLYTKSIGYKNENYEYYIAASDVPIAANLANNVYRINDDIYYKYTPKIDKSNAQTITDIVGDYTDCGIVHFTMEQYKKEKAAYGFECLDFGVTKSSIQSVNYFKRDENNNYKFKITLIPESLPETYTSTMKNITYAESISYKSFVLQGVISSKSGKFLSMYKTETYDMKLKGIDFKCSSYSNIVINSCGRPIEVPRPFEGEI